MRRVSTNVLVIGGGAAGMAAAVGAAERGVKVILVERDDRTGGVLNQCIHNGFGLHFFREELTGPEYAERFQKMLTEHNIDTILRGHVWKPLFDENKVWVITASGIWEISYDALVVTTGARERPFGALMIPGDRPSGVFTAGLAQRFVNIENRLPGKRALILGSGDIGLIMARRLTLEGMEVVAVVERLPYPGGLERNVQQCLVDFDIPLLLSHTVVRVEGYPRLQKVWIAKVDEKFRPIPGTETPYEVDTLILSVGLIPEVELFEGSLDIHPKSRGIKVANTGRTNRNNVFAAGNNVVIYDLVDYVSREGFMAGKHAAMFVENPDITKELKRVPIKTGENVAVLSPYWFEPVEDLRLYLRVSKPMEDVILRVKPSIYEKRYERVAPNEMISLTIKADRVSEETDRIEVEVVTNV
ncbi:MAG: hypothetical protein PWP37_1539 [Thermotogota bacterium]|nr:hypothetical protein [Thermotogota bacterium]MDK2865347.1 hypothetical protein [Thermotogota bacterium]HCZ06022.1 pyridine nucleotide-disulfide oxidoreductase [Thermotogota bacterium]